MMKVALVHDYLFDYGGAERVLEALHEIWPEAPVYTAFTDKKALGKFWDKFKNWEIRESWWARVPWHRQLTSLFRFLAPLIWESLDLRGFDVVVSSSAWFMCKGVVTRPGTLHVSYIHTPPRYLYGYATSQNLGKYWPVKIYGAIVNKWLRQYDFLSSQRVNVLVANSTETQRRIKKFYRREAVVIYPPIELKTKSEEVKTKNRSYFLTGGRLVGVKNFELVVEVANKLKLPLKIFGEGLLENKLRQMAGETVEFLGQVSEDELGKLYGGAIAFIAAAKDEDFGMTLVEANTYGVPVVAYKGGGYLDIVRPGVNGVFFEELTEEALGKAIKRFMIYDLRFKKEEIIKSAERFSKERFKKQMRELVEEELKRVRG